MPIFNDNDLIIANAVDQTKHLRFDVQNVTTGTERRILVQNTGTIMAMTDSTGQAFTTDQQFSAIVTLQRAASNDVLTLFQTDNLKTCHLVADTIATVDKTWTLPNLNGYLLLSGNGANPPASGAMGKLALTAQAAAIGATNLTNTTPAGLYEVQYYLSTTTANIADGTIAFQVNYTDRVGATNQATAGTLTLAATSTGTTALKGTFQLYLASGNITYNTTLVGAQTTSRYSLDARCLYLG